MFEGAKDALNAVLMADERDAQPGAVGAEQCVRLAVVTALRAAPVGLVRAYADLEVVSALDALLAHADEPSRATGDATCWVWAGR